MASKRKLKKGFIALSTELFNEAILFRAFSKEEAEKEELNNLIDELIVWTDDVIRRVANPDAKDNPKLVKAYYKALRADIEEKAVEINERLIQALEKL